MEVHYYMQYFPGAKAAGSRQPFTFARRLASRGHQVTVIADRANLDTNRREDPLDEAVGGGGRLRVLRLPALRGGRGSNSRRLGAYLSFMALATARGLAAGKPDVVLGSIQPLFAGLAARAVARTRGVPFVLEVRDLWPDALVVKKVLSPRQARPLTAVVNSLYRSADRIVSITPGIKAELLKKGIDSSVVDVFPNGFDPELFAGSEEQREAIRRAHGWSNDFVAIYTGSYTAVTAVDVYVRAAARVRNVAGLRLALFGNGPTRHAVQALASELQASNVTFHDPVPKTDVPGLLAAADATMMSLFPTPLAHIYFENKFLDYMGAGKGILAALEGEQADIMRRCQTGWAVAPGDDQGFASLLTRARENPAAVSEMGRRGSDLVHRSFLLPDILDRYARVVEAAACRRLASLECWEPYR